MAEDQLILVDETNRAVGSAGKTAVHRQGLLHRAFSIFVVDGRGRIVLQRRNPRKYHSGGLWANSCCGHLVLTRDGPMDALTIEVELASPARLDDPSIASLANAVRVHIKAMVGVTCDVVLKVPGDVPRSQGKAVRVKDLRQTGKT